MRTTVTDKRLHTQETRGGRNYSVTQGEARRGERMRTVQDDRSLGQELTLLAVPAGQQSTCSDPGQEKGWSEAVGTGHCDRITLFSNCVVGLVLWLGLGLAVPEAGVQS